MNRRQFLHKNRKLNIIIIKKNVVIIIKSNIDDRIIMTQSRIAQT